MHYINVCLHKDRRTNVYVWMCTCELKRKTVISRETLAAVNKGTIPFPQVCKGNIWSFKAASFAFVEELECLLVGVIRFVKKLL